MENARRFISHRRFYDQEIQSARVEVATPIYDPEIAQRLEEMFITMLSDNQKAREEDGEGMYHLVYRQEDTPLNSQEFFYKTAYLQSLM